MKAGDKLPSFEKTFTPVELFAYGAATWDWHRMHYDAELAKSKGLPAPMLDGQAYGALLARLAMDWAGPKAFLAKLSFKMKAMTFAGDTLRAEGEVKELRGNTAVLNLRLKKGEALVSAATAEVRLPG